MSDKFACMSEQFEEYGFSFTDLQIQQFYTFYEMLAAKNTVMNLTSITEFTDVMEKHFLDSLLINQVIDTTQPMRVIDLGTGAGFPGIPLKIAFPKLQITLMDSVNKKLRFLDEVISELKLESVETIHARAEELARDKAYREAFDLCVSRAVANLATLEEYCLPFVRVGGKFVSYKSGDVDAEAAESRKACYLLGGTTQGIHRFELGESKRSFVIVDKIRTTPKAYPRKAGTPSKSPLK